MRRLIVSLAASLSLIAFAAPATAPAAIGDPDIFIRNATSNEILVTVHIMLPALYHDRWAVPGQTISFNPGPMAWKGILYVSVRASKSSVVDKNSPHICLTSRPIKGDDPRSFTVHYNGHDCSVSMD